MGKRPKKFYLILSKARNFKYGAFPHTPEGKELAERHIETLRKKNVNEDFYLFPPDDIQKD
jgi:hypothetical protein